jgi:PKD domain
MSFPRPHWRLLPALAVTVALAPAAASRADTFTVTAGDATSLQSALTQAAAHANSSEADVVSVPAGTYTGSFTYTGDAVDIEGAGAAATTLTDAAGGSTTFQIDAPGSIVSGVDVGNTAATFGWALELVQGGAVRDVRLTATGKNVTALRGWGDTSLARAHVVLGSDDTAARMSGAGTMTISQTTLQGAGGVSRGIQADTAGAAVQIEQLRSIDVPYPMRAYFGGAIAVRDSLLVLPAGVASYALDAGDANNPGNFTSTLDADRVTIIGDPTANQTGAYVFANSAGDNFEVSVHDSVIAGVARPLGCWATAGAGHASADWSSLPPTGDMGSCPTTRTNEVTGAPVFADAAAGDYHQRYDSPLNDAGDPAPFTATDDLDGLARPVGRVDLGAYEYQRRPPVVSATATAAGQQVTFAATASDPDPGDSPLAYAWSFDDGATATGAGVTHTFAGGETHTGTVIVTDPAGVTASATASVTVASPGSAVSPTPDHTAPAVTLLVKRHQSLAKALRRGIRARIGCSEACTYKATVLLRARVGGRRIDLPAAGARTVTIRLTRRARAALRRLGRVKLHIRATATDRAGNIGRARVRTTTLGRSLTGSAVSAVTASRHFIHCGSKPAHLRFHIQAYRVSCKTAAGVGKLVDQDVKVIRPHTYEYKADGYTCRYTVFSSNLAGDGEGERWDCRRPGKEVRWTNAPGIYPRTIAP